MRVAIEQRTTSKALRFASRFHGQVDKFLDVVDRLGELLVGHLDKTPGQPHYGSDQKHNDDPQHGDRDPVPDT
jgi:hypothetical protein